MKKTILFLALAATLTTFASAENFVRLPLKGIRGAATSTHPATANLPAGGSPAPRAEIVLNDAALDFGDVNVNTGTGVRIINVRNTGNAPATVSVAAGGPFSVSPDSTCGASLDGGAQCDIGVLFKPTAAGKGQAGSLDVNTSVGNHSIALSGAGRLAAYPVLSVAALSVPGDMLIGLTYKSDLLVTNTGTAAASLSALSTGDPAQFTVSGCTGYLASGATCRATVQFLPAAAAQGPSTTVSIASNATDEYGQAQAASGAVTYAGKVVTQGAVLVDIGSASAPSERSITAATGSFYIQWQNVGNIQANFDPQVTVEGAALTPDFATCRGASPGTLSCALFLKQVGNLPLGVTDIIVSAPHTGLNGVVRAYLRITKTP